jgi:hypothetical protein
MSDRANPDLVTSAAVPVKLCRASQKMILLYGCPSSCVRCALKRAGLLVGAVLTARSLPSAQGIGQYDYLFLGPDCDSRQLFCRALRDCARAGWRIAEVDAESCRVASTVAADHTQRSAA